MPYPHLEAEFLLAVAGLACFMVVWVPLMRFCKRFGPWVEIPVAAIPLVALICICIYFWRRARQ